MNLIFSFLMFFSWKKLQNSQTIDDVLGYISATPDGLKRVCFEEEINQHQQMIDIANPLISIYRKMLKN